MEMMDRLFPSSCFALWRYVLMGIPWGFIPVVLTKERFEVEASGLGPPHMWNPASFVAAGFKNERL
jgi:hypothetical protein